MYKRIGDLLLNLILRLHTADNILGGWSSTITSFCSNLGREIRRPVSIASRSSHPVTLDCLTCLVHILSGGAILGNTCNAMHAHKEQCNPDTVGRQDPVYPV